MVNYPYQRILRACPDGAITRLDSHAMQAMVRDACDGAAHAHNIAAAAKTLMGAARECLANGYIHTARDLYLNAIARITEYAGNTYSHAARDLHYTCARVIDRIDRRINGHTDEPSYLLRAMEFYMALSLDYEVSVLNYDNHDRYIEYREFCRRHGFEE